MKKWLLIIFWIALFLSVIFVFVFARKEEQKTILELPEIMVIAKGESAFLNKDDILQRLHFAQLYSLGQKVSATKLSQIEEYLSEMDEIRSVKVYKNIGKSWNIDIELRNPIARIYNRFGENFYMDEEGFLISKSSQHTARSLIVSGDIPDRYGKYSVNDIINNDSLKTIHKLEEIYLLSNYVCKDPIMRKMIGQIHLEKNGDFVLIPVVGDQLIIFGSAYSEKQVNDKFKRLKIFYKEAMPYEGWAKYKAINVKFDGQIVCKRRNG